MAWHRMDKRYIGDGAYAEITEAGLVLTAENGMEATDRVVLEPEVFDRLLRMLVGYVDWPEDLRLG